VSADVRDLLPLYALGILEPDEARAVERAAAADPALAAELTSYQEAALQLVAPVAPAPDVKARLLVSAGQSRWDRFAARFGAIFDVTVDRARELIGLVERPASWEVPIPGVQLIHFAGGPAAAAADCGFIRLGPGCRFPWHTHKGEEHSIVLAGQVREAGGRLLGPGDELVVADGREHDIVNEGTEDAIFAARAMNGIAVRGM
jgi:mannose-6-phosphate isomerase-like protein (cupin superfamily)